MQSLGALVRRFQLGELLGGFGGLVAGLFDFLGPAAVLELKVPLLGAVERGLAVVKIGLVIDALYDRECFPLLDALPLDDVELLDHAGDLGADQDFVNGDDVTLRLQHHVVGGRIGRNGHRGSLSAG